MVLGRVCVFSQECLVKFTSGKNQGRERGEFHAEKEFGVFGLWTLFLAGLPALQGPSTVPLLRWISDSGRILPSLVGILPPTRLCLGALTVV